MAEIEVRRRSLPTLPVIRERECDIDYKNFALKLPLEINILAIRQNKFISRIAKAYQSKKNVLDKDLPEIAIKTALNISSDSDFKNEASQNFSDKLRKITNNYGYLNDGLISEMNTWLEQREKVIEQLQGATYSLRLIKQATSAITLISTAMELARGIGTLFYTAFEVDLKPKYSNLLSWVIGGVGVTSSILALSYTKQTAEDIFRELREERYLLRNLLVSYRKGNFIDEEVKELFPNGIDLDLVKQLVLDTDESFMDDASWQQYISFAILLPNFSKNQRLINDRKFHASVKAFIECSAAKIWLYRIKLEKLLDDTFNSLENHLDRKNFAGNEVYNQAALTLYPIFFPVFLDSRNMEKLRFICGSLAALSAVMNLNQKDGEGFVAIRRKSEVLLKDYNNIRRFSKEFMNEYD